MPDPKYLKPWHGIPREKIHWNPTVNEDACIGCGTCVTGCSRLVYRFDFEKNKSVVYDPLNCLVGCTTCANICPANAIIFPPLETVESLISQSTVHHAIEDNLIERKEELAKPGEEHLDKYKFIVDKKIEAGPKNLIIYLKPIKEEEKLKDFIPGQYVNICNPDKNWLCRSYSVCNIPDKEGGKVQIYMRLVDGGRFTGWAFNEMKEGDFLNLKGPFGAFRLQSSEDKHLLFVARGAGFAPIKSIIEQVLDINPSRKITLYWGVTHTDDFCLLETIKNWLNINPNFNCVLTARMASSKFTPPLKTEFHLGTVYNALTNYYLEESDLKNTDAYVAGPSKTIREVINVLLIKGFSKERIFVESYGLK
ncbi:MAG: FAD-binding oxidoreductase [Caldisericia bacterium]